MYLYRVLGISSLKGASLSREPGARVTRMPLHGVWWHLSEGTWFTLVFAQDNLGPLLHLLCLSIPSEGVDKGGKSKDKFLCRISAEGFGRGAGLQRTQLRKGLVWQILGLLFSVCCSMVRSSACTLGLT